MAQCSYTVKVRVSRCRWTCRTLIVFLLEWLVSTCLTVAASADAYINCVTTRYSKRYAIHVVSYAELHVTLHIL